MKKLIAMAIVASVALSACESRHNRNSNYIRIKDNENYLNFTANYPENKTATAQQYIEKSFKEDRIFKSVSDVKKVEIRLSDGTQFYLNYEPGYLSIDFERDKNSFTSYNRMKRMIAGFGNALKD
ncbi:MAG: hypothetical protein V4663_08795 [Bacteroidota bacterium]